MKEANSILNNKDLGKSIKDQDMYYIVLAQAFVSKSQCNFVDDDPDKADVRFTASDKCDCYYLCKNNNTPSKI